MKSIAIILLVGQSFYLFGQSASNTESRDENDVYYQALEFYLDKNNMIEEVFIEQNSITSLGMPLKIGGREIILLSNEGIIKKAKKGEFILHRIIPLRFEDGKFYINIIPYRANCKRRNLDLKNQGGEKIQFEYNCKIEKLVLTASN